MRAAEERPSPMVLYVDDDAEDRMLMTEALQIVDPRYKLITVHDGPQALHFLNNRKRDPPCLLILDLNLPGMDGIGLIDKIRQDKVLGTIPVVVFTTSSSSTDQNACASFGVDMITKPISFSDLTRIVKKLLSYCKEEIRP